MHFDMVVGNSVISNTTAPVVFGYASLSQLVGAEIFLCLQN